MGADLSGSTKFALLQKAADIAIGATAGIQNPKVLADIIEATYNKMLELSKI